MAFQKKRRYQPFVIMLGILLMIGVLVFLLLKVNTLEAQKKFSASGAAPKGKVPPVTAQDYMEGNPKAKVTIIEYSDFECPDCQAFNPTLEKIYHEYGSKIRIVSRRAPLPQNKNAEKEAEAALCVGKLGGDSAFWKFYQTIFQHITPTVGGTGLDLSLLPRFAIEAGVSEKAFTKCLSKGEMKDTVRKEEMGAMKAGVVNLPGTFVIDGKGDTILLSGNQSYALLKNVIDAALQ